MLVCGNSKGEVAARPLLKSGLQVLVYTPRLKVSEMKVQCYGAKGWLPSANGCSTSSVCFMLTLDVQLVT